MGKIDFSEDFHPEFDGYLWESGEGVWISFIKSKQEGKGHFRKLIAELKQKYKWIKIPTPSRRMVEIAVRNGFVPKQEWSAEAGETVDMMYWKR